jgi:hypothetical protein
MSKPDLSTVPSFYHNYINLAEGDDVHSAIHINAEKAIAFFKNIPSDKWGYRYAANKWSIGEMLQHIIDAERIFSYRALCIARGEKTSLPGFDENVYAAASGADKRTKEELISEFETVRKGTQQLFASFDEKQLSATGVANNKPISVNAIGFIVPGHVQHHLNILQERYL